MDRLVQSGIFSVSIRKGFKLRKKSKKALVGISLGMMQLLTMSYGFSILRI